jgi:hypothetical protein
MKKRMIIALIALSCVLILCISACNYSDPIPNGMWKSEDPNIIIEINNDFRNSIRGRCIGIGEYIFKGAAIKIYFLNGPGHETQIVDAEAYAEANQFVRSDNTFFKGEYKLMDGKLYLHLWNRSKEETGYEQLVFERVEDCALEE